jgi:nitrogen-specific signal transduction histidine kinase
MTALDSQRHLLEERLQQAQKMEIMGRLTSGVAHDFNNLVTIMTGYSAILLRHLSPDDPLYEAVEEINKASERAASLTRQLLTFCRKQTVEPRILNLNTIVRDLEKMLRRLIGEDIELVTVLDSHLGHIQADPSQLEQVLINLAINARDAMPLGGRLTIATTNITLHAAEVGQEYVLPPGPYVMLTVSDTGCGMDAEIRARLFEPFFTTKKQGEGTGLGLATAHEIVTDNGGAIRVDSTPGLGTTFEIMLPCVEQMMEADGSPPPSGAPLYGSETVLLVEDEEAVRGLVRHCLQGYGYTVLEASHGKAALRLAAQHKGPIHLLLTDVVMPHMSGHELVRRLRPARPDMKILYMSGHIDTPHLPQEALHAPATFIRKPFNPDTLARRVRQVLTKRARGQI